MSSKMAPGKKPQGDLGNGTNKRDLSNASFSRKDSTDGKSAGRPDGKAQNGTRSGFRTDGAISNSRAGQERTLQRWVADVPDDLDGSLEKTTNTGQWDQFAENERLFGLTTDYDENIYTTRIDRSHPHYKERAAAADKKAREIEHSMATTAHVAEERVMDYAGGDDQGADEEDKYSGVRRQQDVSLLATRENRYTPPAKRAPSAQATVAGAPVDPAIISSQLKSSQPKTLPTPKPEESKAPIRTKSPLGPGPAAEPQKAAESKQEAGKGAEAKVSEAKTAERAPTPLRSAAATRTISPQVKEGTPSAAANVEQDVLKSFKHFATRERSAAEKARSTKARADKEVKLTELKKFADSFKLSTPVPQDLIGIIAKDPVKQKEIQAKAQKNAEDVAKAKAEAVTKDKEVPAKDTPAKAAVEATPVPAPPPPEARPAPRPPVAPPATSPSGVPHRHPGARQSFAPQPYHNSPFRNDRSAPPLLAQQNRHQPGNLSQRLRNVEQQKMSQQPNHAHVASGAQDMRLPPTGPANSVDPSYSRRHSHLPPKLNPNSHEFRPNAFAPAFNPNGHPSAGSSPRSAVNNVVDSHSTPTPTPQLIRRKTKMIDVKKCYILAHVKAFQPPPGRTFDDNGGLRPAFDTPPTWRTINEETEKQSDSTMSLNYKEWFDRQPFSGATATPNPPHVMPQIAHQHQLPFHLQHGAQHMAPRQSPHMPPMQMHNAQHGPVPHAPFNNADDHRMMHSNSAQSYASPRMAQVPMAYPPAMSSPAQVPYNQPVMQPFGPGTPQMGQFRSFSNNPQYMPQQQGPMAAPMMIQPQFMGPQGMVAAGHQMQLYPTAAHPQFMPPGAPPQSMPGSNGYPSPGRPTAPMMVHQGSQQGQPVFGMSPSVQYQQPYVPQQPAGQMGRGYNNAGPQHFGTSPQQMHQYGAQHRSGSASYGNKNFANHGQHQASSSSIPAGPHGRTPEGPEEAK